MNPIIVQGIGYLGLLFIVLSFQSNKRGTLLLYFLIAHLLFIVHFGLLGAFTGVAMNLVAAVRDVVFYKKGTNKRSFVYFFMAAFFLAGIVTWTNYISLLPILATLAETYSLGEKRMKVLRILTLIPHPFWFIYNAAVGSYAGMATEIVVVASILIGIFRFDVRKAKNSIS